eukprot:Awhi_evm2s2078
MIYEVNEVEKSLRLLKEKFKRNSQSSSHSNVTSTPPSGSTSITDYDDSLARKKKKVLLEDSISSPNFNSETVGTSTNKGRIKKINVDHQSNIVLRPKNSSNNVNNDGDNPIVIDDDIVDGKENQKNNNVKHENFNDESIIRKRTNDKANNAEPNSEKVLRLANENIINEANRPDEKENDKKHAFFLGSEFLALLCEIATDMR